MKNTLFLFAALIFFSCDNTHIGVYKKEPLPADFTYTILEDTSDSILEKNQLTIELSKKITVGQIATIADELYNSKQKRRRFYIFHTVKGMNSTNGVWAISHFDPELEIQILGSTEEQDSKTAITSAVDGEILGHWRNENSLMGASMILFKDKSDKLNMRITFKDGSIMSDVVTEKKQGSIKVLTDGNAHGEYYVIGI